MSKRASKDAFAEQYMEGGAAVRHRDKRVSRGIAAILFAPGLFVMGLSAYIAAANATAAKPVPGAVLPFVVAGMIALGLVFVLMALSFAVLRTVLTSRELVVKYGLWGPSIPLEAIRSCRVTQYDFMKFGGFGIRLGKGGVWAYVPGPGAVVEIAYDDGSKEKVVQIGAKDAPLLAQRIHEAREALTGSRIATGEQADADAERELEAIAETEAEQAVERQG